jgi:acyl carrier protein phosphodiesterase
MIPLRDSRSHISATSVKVRAMNFLAHLLLAGNDEGLQLGAMLGDFIRGNPDGLEFSAPIRKGILLHRFIDQNVDSLPEVVLLREHFEPPFRRYSGIIIDLAFDHQLALRWNEYSDVSLEQFDLGVRRLLLKYDTQLPDELKAFMSYADSRGLFAAYREEEEILFSLKGLGKRFSRSNPLHRVGEIWPQARPLFEASFDSAFPRVQLAVAGWLADNSQF